MYKFLHVAFFLLSFFSIFFSCRLTRVLKIYIRNQESSIHLCVDEHQSDVAIIIYSLYEKIFRLVMINNEGFRKSDRYHNLFRFRFRHGTKRSKSLDNLYDNHKHRKEGKIKRKNNSR